MLRDTYFCQMRIKLFTLALFTLLSGGSQALNSYVHDVYLSLFQLDYKESTKELLITVKTFTHDLEEAVFIKNGSELRLHNDRSTLNRDSIISDFLLTNFWLKADGNSLDLKFIGWEVDLRDSHTTWIYCEATDVDKFKELDVSCTLMLKAFPQQQNMFFLHTEESEQSMMLNLEKLRGSITIPADQ